MSDFVVPVRKGADGFMVRYNKPKFRTPSGVKVPKKLARRQADFDGMRPVVGSERDGKSVYVSCPGKQKNWLYHRPGSNK